jgi:hypothetical protein
MITDTQLAIEILAWICALTLIRNVSTHIHDVIAIV